MKRAHQTDVVLDSSPEKTASTEQSFILIDKGLKMVESSTILKMSDSVTLHTGETDDLDLTGDSHFVSYV